jgi:hypothetical protein
VNEPLTAGDLVVCIRDNTPYIVLGRSGTVVNPAVASLGERRVQWCDSHGDHWLSLRNALLKITPPRTPETQTTDHEVTA